MTRSGESFFQHIWVEATPLPFRNQVKSDLNAKGGWRGHFSPPMYKLFHYARKKSWFMKDLGDEGKEREDKEQVSAWLHNLLAGILILEVGGKASKELSILKKFWILSGYCLRSDWWPTRFSWSLTKSSWVCIISLWHSHLTQIQQRPLSVKPFFNFWESTTGRQPHL